MRNDADNIRRKTEELNNKIQEFKDLLTQAKNETPINEDSELKANEAPHSNEGDLGATRESNLSPSVTPQDDQNEVLSLKSLASSVIENSQNDN